MSEETAPYGGGAKAEQAGRQPGNRGSGSAPSTCAR